MACNFGAKRQCVVARRPSSRPLAASKKAPMQTLAVRRAAAEPARTTSIVCCDTMRSGNPKSPTTMNVSIASASATRRHLLGCREGLEWPGQIEQHKPWIDEKGDVASHGRILGINVL